ncbi:hypothetical protein BVRB_7g179930 [Beta vulgaris subsp. vulgaris]|uniref:Uncharacterized protein n=1 Tax=Beta vulgaris subsp. vulgaris TaxID=3555 RepID=A0A0J8B7K5_BETVV|nr:hypothetical protein BVRB_7g179930 [Beta vulgaris subsp. vulgaris]
MTRGRQSRTTAPPPQYSSNERRDLEMLTVAAPTRQQGRERIPTSGRTGKAATSNRCVARLASRVAFVEPRRPGNTE